MAGEVRGLYLDKMNAPYPTKESNIELFTRLEDCTEEERPIIINDIVQNNLRVIHNFIYKWFKGYPWAYCERYRMTYGDLFSLALEYLVQSIPGYDLSRGVSFPTYANQAMFNYYQKYFFRLKSLSPDDESLDKLVHTKENNSEEGASLLDLLVEDTDEYSGIDTTQMILKVMEILEKTLTGREMYVMTLRFEQDMTQSQIAEEVGVSQMQVSRILKKAQEKLKVAMKGWTEVV